MLDTTRRALIAGTASLTALSIPTVASAHAPAYDAGLLRRIAAYRSAKAMADNWHKTVFEPASDAFNAACKAVPHHTTAASFENMLGARVHLSTASEGAERIVRTMQRDGQTYGNDDYAECMKELQGALDKREAELARIKDEWSATGLVEHSDALGERNFDAFCAIYAYPVSTIADLTLKLETIREIDDEKMDLDDLLADLKRIAGRA